MEKLALVSTYNKDGLESFVRVLTENGYRILSTGGTYTFLKEKGFDILSVSDYTKSPEILDGRVKTLHPKVHAGILARRDNKKDLDELALVEAGVIDFVVVNLYPFLEKVRDVEAKREVKHPSLIEFIDIGGPTMLRAAAKNCAHVVPVCDPGDYQRVADELRAHGAIGIETRRELASKVFATMSAYDGAVARYFSLQEQLLDEKGAKRLCAPVEAFALQREIPLRYGENPHQRAGLYREVSFLPRTKPWHQLQGKEISYNNLLDMHAALDLFLEIFFAFEGREVSVIIKHLNPCGVAVRDSNLQAFRDARSCDPTSAFGGIVAVSGIVDGALAQAITEGFVEIVLAQSFSAECLEVFHKKKNVRLIQCDFAAMRETFAEERLSIRNFYGDYLVQTTDSSINPVQSAKIVTQRKPTASELSDMELAWRICKHVKSNAIVLVKDLLAIGIGAGQMSRVDSARISLDRAAHHKHNVVGAVAASDAFLPFPDTLEILNDAKIAALVQPGGSIKDEEVVAVADKRQMAMVITGDRHFRH